MPGVCALVTNGDSDIAVWSAGWHTYDDGSTPVRADDLFDLASVTKVVSAATLCAILVDKGRLDLDRPVSEILGVTSMDSRVTPRSLLAHCSGLPAHVHLYKRLISREEVIDAVLSMDLEYEPLSQSVYSDMGYILLGAILEHVTEKPLNELFRDYVREPLGLYETVYSPTPSNRDRIVPTELDLGWRGRLIHGEVHDENAALMRGIAPHAGLFSTVGNVGRVARMWINGGEVGGRKFLSAETIKLFRSRSDLVAGSTWALGWDTVSPGGSTSGQHFSHDSYGILGYTGTSIWVDPEREVAVVLLTNRVHPTRDNWGIRELRPAFHDAVMEAVLAGGV
jgi:CubicO group peptidase (beta-lactamase class C family)